MEEVLKEIFEKQNLLFEVLTLSPVSLRRVQSEKKQTKSDEECTRT